MGTSEDNVLHFMSAKLPQEIESLIKKGEFRKARNELKALLSSSHGPMRRRIEFELDRLERWPYQYPYSLEEALRELKKRIPDITTEDILSLVKEGCVDYRTIEGEIRIFQRFVPNLFWLCPKLKERAVPERDEQVERSKKALRDRVFKTMEVGRLRKGHLLPLKYRIRSTVAVKPHIVPKDAKLRIWIPLPRRCGMHSEVKVLDSSHEPYISEESYPQRTAYFEVKSSEEGAKVWIEYEVISRSFYVNLKPSEVEYEINTQDGMGERIPHIMFTDRLRNLALSIVGGEENPLMKAKKIWDWIIDNVIYTYVHDYALFDNISEFVALKRRGDCGIQAILFITLLRIIGIPAKWQSGWYANPVKPGMHDWAQFYIEPYGWLYADPSFGHPRDGQDWRRDFYFGNIEGFRLAFNSEISYRFDPPKEHFRSDPVDSQRGEVEWDEGNLYYDDWDFSLQILDVKSVRTTNPLE